MAFRWEEYLQVAQFLHAEGGTNCSKEAAERSAVSRAYYAAFCHARNYARNQHGFTPTGGPRDHQSLREFFQHREPQVATRLSTLRQWRNHCDYDDRVADLSAFVQKSLAYAEEVIHRCR